jgi:hypothetical protein
VIASTDALDLDIAALVKLGEDPVDSTFRDSHQPCDVSLTQIAVAIQGEQYVAMVCEKGPVAHETSRWRTHDDSI